MLRIGIVGAGLRGHLYARSLEGRADIVGFAEPSQKAREAAAEAGFDTHASHGEMLERTAPDAVVIATPDFAHREAAVDCARAGTHLFVEKPLATSLADARAIEQAVRDSGVQCMVGFENRWNPHFVALGAALSDGRVGRPVAQSATLSNTLYVPTTMLSWSASSSPIWFLMPHVLDLAFWLADADPVSVFARGRRGILAARGIDTWDVVHTSIGLADGSMVDVTSSWILPEAHPTIADFTYRVVGDAGSATVDHSDQGLSISHSRHESIAPLGGEINGEPVGMATWMIQRFVSDVEAGLPVSPGLAEGVRVTAALDAVERSLEAGTVVEMGSTA